MDFRQIFMDTLKQEALALSEYDGDLGDLDSIIKLILSLKGKLAIVGIGKSGLIAQKIAATLSSTGTPSFFLHPSEAMHGDLGVLQDSDCVLAISYSGESAEIVEILPHIRRFGLKIITMSRSRTSKMSALGDFFLPIEIKKEACPLNTAPTTSTTLSLAMGDALAVCLMNARHFTKGDFAAFHPGGSLGRELFVKVADLMQRSDLPLLNVGVSLKDAIFVMSKGRLGNAFFIEDSIEDSGAKNSKNANVIESKVTKSSKKSKKDSKDLDSKAIKNFGKLLGVLSDGDLRRAMCDSDFSLESSAFNYATKKPKMIEDSNMLAIDALKIMKDSKIQILPIVDKNKNLQGVIHLHTLIQAGFKTD